MDGVKYSAVDSNERFYKEISSHEKKNDVDCHGESKSKIFLYISACAAHFPAFACGISMGWTSPVIPKLDGSVDPENNPLHTPLTPYQASWVASLLPMAAIFGPFVAGILVNKIGRKNMLLISMVPFLIAFVTAAFAQDVHLFYVVRFLCGLALGIVFSVTPIYIAEISEKSVRGSLGALLGTFICLGILTSYALGPYVSLLIYNLLCALVPILFIPLFWFYIPETPHFLIMANQEDAAERALMKFRSRTQRAVQKEFDEIKDTVKEHASGNLSLYEILCNRGLKRALVITVGLVTFQQLSGINVILFYAQTIFSETGSSIPPHVCAIIKGAIQVVSTILIPFFAERAGKKILLILSAVGMMVSVTALGTYFYLRENHHDVTTLFWLPVLTLACYVFMFNVGFSVFPFAIMGEIFPHNAIPVAATVTISVCWLEAFVITKFFHHVTGLIGTAVSFWLFAGFCALASAFVYKLVPETSGKSLREVQNILNE